jgi:D-glycero-D-manno-heptose 1,7-bisphosphate phosphatase
LPRLPPAIAADPNQVVSRRAVFLDRDGVINRAIVRGGKPYSLQSVDELEILPGVPEALERLRFAGYLNVVVTNQPDVGSGKLQRSAVEAMHARLRERLAIDAVKVCYHTEAQNCACRKPKPGMIRDASHELGIDVGRSYLVGDRWRDVGAAQAAGCRALFINYGYAEKMPDEPYVPVNSLPEAAEFILRSS